MCHFYRSLGVRVKQQGRPHKQECRHFHFKNLVAQVTVVHIGAGVFLSPFIFPPCSRGTGVTVSTRTFPCSSCGSHLEFIPGLQALQCHHCGNETPLEAHNAEALAASLQELDYKSWLARAAAREPRIERLVVTCPGCGSSTQLPQNVMSAKCPFCVAPLLAANAHAEQLIQPRAMLVFQIDADQALERFQQWVRSLKYAPSDLKTSLLEVGELKAVYLPFWTFDCTTITSYKRLRKDWRGALRGLLLSVLLRKLPEGRLHALFCESRQVLLDYDDLIAPASRSLSLEYLAALEPWAIEHLVPYREDVMAGFTVEVAQVGLASGFETAGLRMKKTAVARAVGLSRDAQQELISFSPAYYGITFRQVLLPVWVTTYRYQKKTMQVVINGQTGKVYGRRPWSSFKMLGLPIATVVVTLGFSLWQAGFSRIQLHQLVPVVIILGYAYWMFFRTATAPEKDGPLAKTK